MKLRGLVPNSHIPESVKDLYVPKTGLSILLQFHFWEYINWIFFGAVQMLAKKGETND
jgi:hypothetical protein